MQYSVSIDIPTIDEGLTFHGQALGFVGTPRPVDGYAATVDIGPPVHVDFSVDDFGAVLESVLGAGLEVEECI